MKIAIIGCGEVGCAYATAFAEAGQPLALCAPRPSEAVQKLATQHHLPLHQHAGEWLSQIDIVICCTPSTAALTVTKEALPFMKKGALFADFSSSTPDHKREAAVLTVSKDLLFVDVVILGSVDLMGAATPLLCAGAGSETIKSLMQSVGASVKILPDGKPGDAAALKLLRSVFIKGLMTLTVECVVAAEYQGIKGLLYELLSDLNQRPFTEFLDMFLRNHVTHACRQRQEVADATAQLQALGLQTHMLPAIEALLANTCAHIKINPLPHKNPSTEEALAWLLKTRELKNH